MAKITSTAYLTDIGLKRLSENRFDVTKYVPSDSGINYRNIDDFLIDSDLKIKRQDIKNFPLVPSYYSLLSNTENYPKHYFSVGLDPVVDGSDKSVVMRESDESKIFSYRFFTSDPELKTRKSRRIVTINENNLPDDKPNSYITVALENSQHFDIRMTERTAERFNKNVTSEEFLKYVYKLNKNVPNDFIESFFNINNNRISEILARNSVSSDHLLVRNMPEAVYNTNDRDDAPKVINIPVNINGEISSFDLKFELMYKGNLFSKKKYYTNLVLFYENTGQHEIMTIEAADVERKFTSQQL